MKAPRMCVVIESRLDCVALAGHLARTFCEHAGASPLESGQIELCVVEAMNNCIFHAYKLRAGQSVRLCVSKSGLNLVFEICDWGRAMHPKKLRDGREHVLNIDETEAKDLRENGRGLAIMQSLMDTVRYSSLRGSNRLKLTKTLVRTGA